MRKFKLFAILLVTLLATASFGDHRGDRDFLATAITSIASTATATNGTDFTSRELTVPTQMATLIVTFTCASGDANNADFYFQASYDKGATWTTEEFILIQRPTNEDAVSNAVRYAEVNWFQGVSHIRLWKVKNNNASTAITSVNATLSWGER